MAPNDAVVAESSIPTSSKNTQDAVLNLNKIAEEKETPLFGQWT